MEITGKVIWCGEIRSGVSAQSGKDWASQDFVVEQEFTTPYGTQVVRVALNIFGNDRVLEADLHTGDVVKVNYGINAREYQGKWFNDVRASKVTTISSAANGNPVATQQAARAQAAPTTKITPQQQEALDAARKAFAESGGDPNDLPF